MLAGSDLSMQDLSPGVSGTCEAVAHWVRRWTLPDARIQFAGIQPVARSAAHQIIRQAVAEYSDIACGLNCGVA